MALCVRIFFSMMQVPSGRADRLDDMMVIIVRARDKQTNEIVALKQIRMEGEKSGVYASFFLVVTCGVHHMYLCIIVSSHIGA